MERSIMKGHRCVPFCSYSFALGKYIHALYYEFYSDAIYWKKIKDKLMAQG